MFTNRVSLPNETLFIFKKSNLVLRMIEKVAYTTVNFMSLQSQFSCFTEQEPKWHKLKQNRRNYTLNSLLSLNRCLYSIIFGVKILKMLRPERLAIEENEFGIHAYR